MTSVRHDRVVDRLLRAITDDPAEAGGAASEWRRPLPSNWFRVDATVALVVLALAIVMLELFRSSGSLGHETHPLWQQYLLVVTATALLVWRRRFPMTIGLVTAVHLIVATSIMPLVGGQLVLQVAYFVAIYSSTAWARDRRRMGAMLAAIAAILALWTVWYFALGRGAETAMATEDDDVLSTGVIGRFAAVLVLTCLINIAYFGGAAVLGIASWRSARRAVVRDEQAATIAAQADRLRDRAVLDERLRIARELHDVVAHHVAAIGVQAGAARRVLASDPEAASGALRSIEGSSRSAVEEMRALLGTLREGPATGGGAEATAGRHPDPGLADLPALVDEADDGVFRAELRVVTDPGVPLERVPAAAGLSLYRTVQEALANVRRHSTAGSARVSLRTGRDGSASFVEVEVLDDGRPRAGTAGSGMGQLGMRERVASHRGSCEIGPRATGGYRVRVRIPVEAS